MTKSAAQWYNVIVQALWKKSLENINTNIILEQWRQMWRKAHYKYRYFSISNSLLIQLLRKNVWELWLEYRILAESVIWGIWKECYYTTVKETWMIITTENASLSLFWKVLESDYTWSCVYMRRCYAVCCSYHHVYLNHYLDLHWQALLVLQGLEESSKFLHLPIDIGSCKFLIASCNISIFPTYLL